MSGMAIVLTLLAAAGPTPADACPREPATKAGLLLAERHWIAALETRDVARLACSLAQGFTDNNWQGRLITRSEMLAALPSRPDAKLRLQGLRVRRIGAVGIVTGLSSRRGLQSGLDGTVRFTDVFFRQGGRWRAVAAQETLVASGAQAPAAIHDR
jgi:uncharacterized protein DUF4440